MESYRTQGDRRWTLSFYQAKAGVREITVTDGPCLTGNTTVEVVSASQLEGAVARMEEAEAILRSARPFLGMAIPEAPGSIAARVDRFLRGR